MSNFIVFRKNELYNIRSIYVAKFQRVYNFIGVTPTEANHVIDVERYGRLINLNTYHVDTIPDEYVRAIIAYDDRYGLDKTFN